MKRYIKPSLTYTGLRVEESLAGTGSSITVVTENKYLIEEHTVSYNSFSFWLRILRK